MLWMSILFLTPTIPPCEQGPGNWGPPDWNAVIFGLAWRECVPRTRTGISINNLSFAAQGPLSPGRLGSSWHTKSTACKRETHLSSLSRHLTKMGRIPDFIKSSMGGFLSLESSFLIRKKKSWKCNKRTKLLFVCVCVCILRRLTWLPAQHWAVLLHYHWSHSVETRFISQQLSYW